MRTRVTIVAMLVLASSFLYLPTVNAYVDPGSGSFVFQALIAGLLAAGMAVKVFWRRIAAFFSRKPAAPVDEG